MKSTIALTLLVLAGAMTAGAAQAAPTSQQQMRQHFTDTMVKPCEGKKAGDTVTITDRRGGKHTAICTLTALPVAE
ncbi:hypothetical protein [Scandinavium goeteborgense]|jgi:hypothetical protein|uniref:Uncharacterized protein n=1 Tax=Scandinavium goeteborgense TaxID=1851514 RepID=A0A4R6EXT1_SCAGO|nr:hypothetical protein [Scandinavium goeteborgense]QKN82463.1 hypothetical protein A8O29_014630 [Scandinavium goeteborgense]TDN64614.1 hypothetical protein EC847_101545 [Scandinavium goeteborgense]